MSRTQELRHSFQDRMAELKTLRDQIRVDLHLASMDLRDEWKKLEKRLPDPVVANDQLKEVTVESVEKLARELSKFRERLLDGRPGQPLAAFMTTAVATCAASDSAALAMGTMWDRDLGFLPVVDAAQKLLGVITDRDAAMAAWSRGQRLEDITVDSIMSKTVHSCAPDDDAGTALAMMRTQQIRRLPIVAEGGRLMGVVTLADLARGLGADGATVSSGTRQVIDAFLGILTSARNHAASTN